MRTEPIMTSSQFYKLLERLKYYLKWYDHPVLAPKNYTKEDYTKDITLFDKFWFEAINLAYDKKWMKVGRNESISAVAVPLRQSMQWVKDNKI